MTRVNCVPVEELADQHLLAEYREITRISSLSRVLDSYGQYRMGTGHVKFFYNKGLYLGRRARALYKECLARGFNVQQKIYVEHPPGLNEDWIPQEEDIIINRRRIEDKIQMKPDWYKWTKCENTSDQRHPPGNHQTGCNSKNAPECL